MFINFHEEMFEWLLKSLGCAIFQKFFGLNPVLVDLRWADYEEIKFFEIGHCLPLPLSGFR